MNLKEGQTVWLRPEGNAARRTSEIFETTIVSIGRKYGTLATNPLGDVKFELEDLYEVNDCTPNYQIYTDKEEAYNPMRKSNKRRDIIDLIADYNYNQLCKIEEYLKSKPFI